MRCVEGAAVIFVEVGVTRVAHGNAGEIRMISPNKLKVVRLLRHHPLPITSQVNDTREFVDQREVTFPDCAHLYRCSIFLYSRANR